MNSNFDTGILSATHDAYVQDVVTDNIFDSNALLHELKAAGAVESQDGGKRILEPLMYDENSTADSYSGYDELDTTPQEGITDAEFDWKQYSVQTSFSGKEERINSGKSAAISLIKTKMVQAEKSLVKKLNDGLYEDGTGNGGKNLTGLGIMVETTGTYGGISHSGYSYWQSYEENTSAVITTKYVRDLVSGVSSGGKDTPNLGITTDTLYNKIEDLIAANQRFVDTKKADVGFDNILFKGMMLTWDETCPSGTLYGLNTNYMKLRYHPEANFTTVPFVQPTKQDAKVGKILWMGNLTCNQVRRQGKLTGKTAA